MPQLLLIKRSTFADLQLNVKYFRRFDLRLTTGALPRQVTFRNTAAHKQKGLTTTHTARKQKHIELLTRMWVCLGDFLRTLEQRSNDELHVCNDFHSVAICVIRRQIVVDNQRAVALIQNTTQLFV